MMRQMLGAALVAASFLATPTVAHACSCVPPDVVFDYRTADHVFAGRVVGVRQGRNVTVYDVLVWQTAKSCLAEGTVVQVGTSSSSAACGASLQVGANYVLFANDTVVNGVRRMITSSCSGTKTLSLLTPDERAFLVGRELNCATDGCVDGSPQFNCFVDPCTQVTPCSPTAECEPNYCGGCIAEFYDGDYAACLPWTP